MRIGILIACLLSALTWLVDHDPKYYLGDSSSYLLTAVQGFIPPDRSFVYGFIIRAIALPVHSLAPLLTLQAIAGVVSVAGFGYCLSRFGPSNRPLLILLMVLFSVEPMHMLFQRFVLTEAITMPIFIAYLGCVFSYFRNTHWSKLVLLQLLGLGLIAMRLIFLPLVFANALVAPLFGRKAFSHIAINVALIVVLHGGYCVLNGRLSHAPPSYSYWDGFFQVSAWAPAVTVNSAANETVAEIIRHGDEYGLTRFNKRIFQLWNEKGFCALLRNAAPNLYVANQWAKITAHRTVEQRPFHVAAIVGVTYLLYNSYLEIHRELRVDRGDDIPVTNSLVERLTEFFPSHADDFDWKYSHFYQKSSLTKRIQSHCWLWFMILVQTPAICLLAGLWRREVRLLGIYLSIISFIYMVTVCALTPLVVVRLLYPLTVPLFLIAGWIAASRKNLHS